MDTLIWAIGREPATDVINLEVTGVKTNSRGQIIVDKYQNTNVPGIYAVGDIIEGGIELTPVADGSRSSFYLSVYSITNRMNIWITTLCQPLYSAILQLVQSV